MDISCNLLDLKYLINPAFSTILNNKDANKSISKKELEFYKRRIFLLTKDFLQGTRQSELNINMIFDKYAKECIEYFKFNDKKEIIQGDYVNLQNTKKSCSHSLVTRIFHRHTIWLIKAVN